MSQNSNTTHQPQADWQMAAGDTNDWRGHTPTQQQAATGYTPPQDTGAAPYYRQG